MGAGVRGGCAEGGGCVHDEVLGDQACRPCRIAECPVPRARAIQRPRQPIAPVVSTAGGALAAKTFRWTRHGPPDSTPRCQAEHACVCWRGIVLCRGIGDEVSRVLNFVPARLSVWPGCGEPMMALERP